MTAILLRDVKRQPIITSFAEKKRTNTRPATAEAKRVKSLGRRNVFGDGSSEENYSSLAREWNVKGGGDPTNCVDLVNDSLTRVSARRASRLSRKSRTFRSKTFSCQCLRRQWRGSPHRGEAPFRKPR